MLLLSFLNKSNNYPTRNLPRLNNIRETIAYNHDRIRDYWRNMNWVVKSEHILVGLLQSMHTEAVDKRDVYRTARNQLSGELSIRGFATGYSYGRIQPRSHFYGNGCAEIYLEQEFDDSIESLFSKNYKNYEPIRVVDHPFTSFDFQLANGKPRKSGETGLVIIKIDTALLFTQYVSWRRDKAVSEYEDGTPKSIMNFLHAYPIPNMLRSHTDRVWFNRMFNVSLGKENNNTREDHRHFVGSPYYYVDEFCVLFDRLVKRSRADFHEWCCWMPGIFKENLKEFLKDDNVLKTDQNKLPKEISYLSTLEWLTHNNKIVQPGGNGMYISEYERWFRFKSNGNRFVTIRNLDGNIVKDMFIEKVNKNLE